MKIGDIKPDSIEVIDLEEEIELTTEKLKSMKSELDRLYTSELRKKGNELESTLNQFLHKKVKVEFENYLLTGILSRVSCTPCNKRLCIELVINGFSHGTYEEFSIEEIKIEDQ